MKMEDEARCDTHSWRCSNPDKECPHCLKVDAIIEDLRECLRCVKAALGDRLCAGGPLSKEYAHEIMAKIDKALS